LALTTYKQKSETTGCRTLTPPVLECSFLSLTRSSGDHLTSL
jgi:hypothetical protein